MMLVHSLIFALDFAYENPILVLELRRSQVSLGLLLKRCYRYETKRKRNVYLCIATFLLLI